MDDVGDGALLPVAAESLIAECALGVTRACGLVGISRSLYRYHSRLPWKAKPS